MRALYAAILVAVAFGVASPTPALEGFELDDLRDPDVLARVLRDQPSSIRLIDVRTAGEYASGHISGAEHIDHREIGAAMQDGERQQLIVVYCRSGNRSGRAARVLASLGYQRVVDFGGINRWSGPIETQTSR